MALRGRSGRRTEAYYERERLSLASGRRGILYPSSDLASRVRSSVLLGRLRGTWGSSGVRVAAAAFGRGGGRWPVRDGEDENGRKGGSKQRICADQEGMSDCRDYPGIGQFADFRSPVAGGLQLWHADRARVVSCWRFVPPETDSRLSKQETIEVLVCEL